MTEAGIGRILVASLHQGIADLLPTRLEFYENWLSPDGLRHGTIGLAPLKAVLSFLRQEGAAYDLITRRAGAYAADWTVAAQWPAHRSMVESMPAWIRARAALRVARRTVRATYVGTRVGMTLRRGKGTATVRGSLFCDIRDSSSDPLCGFYAATLERFLELYSVPAGVHVDACLAVGAPSCLMAISFDRRRAPSVISLTPRE